MLIEERPEWLTIMRHLEAHQARHQPGYRVEQSAFAKAVGMVPRTLRTYLSRMEEYGVLVVRRTTIDNSFGSPRGFNIYLLKCSSTDWETRLGPAYANQRRERLSNRLAAQARNREAERRRTQPPSARAVARARPKLVEPSAAEIAVLAAEIRERGDDLRGW